MVAVVAGFRFRIQGLGLGPNGQMNLLKVVTGATLTPQLGTSGVRSVRFNRSSKAIVEQEGPCLSAIKAQSLHV